MTFQSNTAPLAHRDLADYGVARFRDRAFDAVLALWRRRQSEGWTQKRVADTIGRDPGWVSRNLRAPGNWTLRTVGELVQGLDGEVEVAVAALEDQVQFTSNSAAYDAYDGYKSSELKPTPEGGAPRPTGVVTSAVVTEPNQTKIEITSGGFQVPVPDGASIYERVTS